MPSEVGVPTGRQLTKRSGRCQSPVPASAARLLWRLLENAISKSRSGRPSRHSTAATMVNPSAMRSASLALSSRLLRRSQRVFVGTLPAWHGHQHSIPPVTPGGGQCTQVSVLIKVSSRISAAVLISVRVCVHRSRRCAELIKCSDSRTCLLLYCLANHTR